MSDVSNNKYARHLSYWAIILWSLIFSLVGVAVSGATSPISNRDSIEIPQSLAIQNMVIGTSGAISIYNSWACSSTVNASCASLAGASEAINTSILIYQDNKQQHPVYLASQDLYGGTSQQAERVDTIQPPPANTGISTHRSTNWEQVAICETGGNWKMRGPKYSGGLGFLNSSWVEYGGLEFSPDAGMATPYQQIVVADRIQKGRVVAVTSKCAAGGYRGW